MQRCCRNLSHGRCLVSQAALTRAGCTLSCRASNYAGGDTTGLVEQQQGGAKAAGTNGRMSLNSVLNATTGSLWWAGAETGALDYNPVTFISSGFHKP